MEKVASRIFDEIDGGYRHAFILSDNVRDYVWDQQHPDCPPSGFPFGLCRTLGARRDNKHTTVALYSLSQGITLFRNGEFAAYETEQRPFIDLTGLGDLVVTDNMTAEDMRRIVQEPHSILPALTAFLVDDQSRNFLVIDSCENLTCLNASQHELYDRAVHEILLSWARDSRISDARNGVVLICSEKGQVPEILVRGDNCYTRVEVDYPQTDERISFLIERGVSQDEAILKGNLTTGFRRIDLDEVARRNLDAAQIAERKASIIASRCGDSLEFVRSSNSLTSSNAQPHVRDYLMSLSRAIKENPDAPAIPKGILFVGVPGNGKSHVAQAFANDCGMNMLKFKNVRSQYVGESERRLNAVLDVLPSLAPSVVFIDEIDQMVSSRSAGAQDHDSGVEQRLLGRLLDFIGDSSHRGKILWIGATNRPDLIDEAMLRRFDRVMPFMNPSGEAKAALVNDLTVRLSIGTCSDFDAGQAAACLDDCTCDEVEKIIRRAQEIAGNDPLSTQHVRKAASIYHHNYNPHRQLLIALLSLAATPFVTDLPWFDADGGAILEDLPQNLRGVITEGGIQENLLQNRIEEARNRANLH